MGIAFLCKPAVFFGLAIYSLMAFSLTASGLTIKPIDDCSAFEPAVNSIDILDSAESINRFQSWNHSHSGNGTSKEFDGLVHAPEAYDVDRRAWTPNKYCQDRPTLDTILAVKINDWTRQHVNGIESLVTSPKVPFGQVQAVRLVFRISPDKTRLLTSDELVRTYSNWVEPSLLKKLDADTANLGLTVFAEGALDQSTRSLNATLNLKLDNRLLYGGWIEVVAPLDDFNYFFEREYRRDAVHKDEIVDELVAGFRLTAETKNGEQLRNLLGATWKASIPESFKELAIELRLVQLVIDSGKNHSLH